ncbi:endonuclease/exonuclease/phosphatase family protein [Psychroserpens luteolus]|uniref:endonuclease/exonuclease/phosphatase family protein n=1 Tax=Psychroserpens luteolus TaxID=2855840 RepID=UPI001E63D12D|nr:endonuclease/exonuclease/phosphatase family protein [Psychroserpens luteolus]MCD2260651.1 endonuclease/exonuclease/phosphatase family protein [Psychroserpens luteolus]
MTLTLKLKQNYKAYLLIGYAFLLIVHFILKDHIFPISIVFYAFPVPILILSGLFLVLLFFRRKVYRFGILALVILLSLHWLQDYYMSSEIKTPKDTSKILFWNLAKRKQLSVSYLSKQVNTYQPEILAFVEAPHTTLKNLDSLKKVLPNYNFMPLKGAMLIAAKHDIELLEFSILEDAYKINLLEINTKDSKLKLIITDLTANILVNKKNPLAFVSNFAKTNNVDLVVGDFNTPYESVFFETYKNDFTSFHEYTNGFTATWPLGIPLFELDHIWLANRHSPQSLIKYYSDASDHALLISEFIINQ